MLELREHTFSHVKNITRLLLFIIHNCYYTIHIYLLYKCVIMSRNTNWMMDLVVTHKHIFVCLFLEFWCHHNRVTLSFWVRRCLIFPSLDGANFWVAGRGVNFDDEKVLSDSNRVGAYLHHDAVSVAAVVKLAPRQTATSRLFVQFHILWKYDHKK